MKRLVIWIVAILCSAFVVGAQAAETPLGSGDLIRISVYGNPDLGLETRLNSDGAITFPLVGAVTLSGLPIPEAEKKLSSMLESGGFVRKAQVNIVVTGQESQQISVLGQVNRPGRYPVEGKRTLMDVLAQAGGMNPDGGDTASVIRKRNGVTTKDVIDVVQMVRTGDFSQDFELAPNDIVFVERAPKFYIYGEVLRPGAFRLERAMTAAQALSVGGGLTPRGTERGMRIKRRDTNGVMQIIDAKADDLLQVDDVVYIKESLF